MDAGQQERARHAVYQAAIADGVVPGLYLGYLPYDLRDAPKDYFGYGMDFLTIAAAGGAATSSFNVQSDSDFLITQVQAAVNDPAAPETPLSGSGLLVQVTDSGSGRQLYDRQVPLLNVAGTGALPGFYPWPKFIDRSSTVSATITNNRADAQDVRVRLTFVGFKVFSRSQAGLR
jgi:hypothetical protein